MRYYILLPIFIFILSGNVFCQKDTTTEFTVTGKIIGQDTGRVFLVYSNAENTFISVPAVLKNGEFKFTGRVNRVSDANLWTDPKNIIYRSPTVVRFLLEPGKINIIYNDTYAIITGSKTQLEKENFDKEKRSFEVPKDEANRKIFSLLKNPDLHTNPNIKKEIDELFVKINLLNTSIKPIDLNYIRDHTGSYLSGFLLSTYTRK